MDEGSAIRGTGNDFGPMNPHCRSCELGPPGFNVPRRFVTSILYMLPFGKGQRLLNHGGIIDQAFGGWQLSTVTAVQDGASIVTSSWASAGQVIVPRSNQLNCTGISPVADAPTADRYFIREAFSNRCLRDQGLPDQRETCPPVPDGDVQRSEPSGVG